MGDQELSGDVLVVGLNPAVDVTYRIPALRHGTSHRVDGVHRQAGGKALNVVRILHQMAVPARLLAFAGGTTGDFLSAELTAAGISAQLVPTSAATRSTVAVVDAVDATLFNEPGSPVSAAEWAAFQVAFAGALVAAAVVVLSGSVPPGPGEAAYHRLVSAARAAGRPTVLDAAGVHLQQALSARPIVVKPNHHEAGELLGRALQNEADGIAAAREIQRRGAANVLVSRGTEGLIAATTDGIWSARADEPVLGNPTGAGDAMVAAMAAGLRSSAGWPELLREAVAWSAGAVAVDVAGGLDLATVIRVRQRAEVMRRATG